MLGRCFVLQAGTIECRWNDRQIWTISQNTTTGLFVFRLKANPAKCLGVENNQLSMAVLDCDLKPSGLNHYFKYDPGSCIAYPNFHTSNRPDQMEGTCPVFVFLTGFVFRKGVV